MGKHDRNLATQHHHERRSDALGRGTAGDAAAAAAAPQGGSWWVSDRHMLRAIIREDEDFLWSGVSRDEPVPFPWVVFPPEAALAPAGVVAQTVLGEQSLGRVHVVQHSKSGDSCSPGMWKLPAAIRSARWPDEGPRTDCMFSARRTLRTRSTTNWHCGSSRKSIS
mmetsp:Transcript_25296/g.100836  ORF Transcript_25296/g.100836 Transcript_25296/m.100836 type:complete len:166 (+) Transcript_25296:115-612(+)